MHLYYRRANNGRITTTTIPPREPVNVLRLAGAAISSFIGLYLFLLLVLSL